MYIDTTLYTGRPADTTGRLEKEVSCYDLLDSLQIPYERVDHDAADTIPACEEVEKYLGTKICKNLVLCNRQKTDFYLLLMDGEKPFRTKDLSKQIGSSRLSFATPEDMEKHLLCPWWIFVPSSSLIWVWSLCWWTCPTYGNRKNETTSEPMLPEWNRRYGFSCWKKTRTCGIVHPFMI